MVATVNNFGGFYSTEHYLQEARLHGGEVVAPCVNRSAKLTTIDGRVLILGLQHVQGLESAVSKALLIERRRGGVYQSMEDLIDRIAISL